MSKKIFVMFLAVFMMIFAVSAAMGANAYTLAGSDKMEPDDPEAYETNPTEGYEGSTYTATFSKPEVILWGYDEEYADDDEQWANVKLNGLTDYTLSWSISPDISGLTVTESSDASGDILILSGNLPNEVGTHDFGFVVSVKSVTNTTDHSGAVGTSFNFSTSETLDILSGDKAYSLMSTAGPEEDPADPEGYSTNTEEGYISSNYKAVYTRPKLVLWEYRKDYPEDENEWINLGEKISFDIVWTLSPDIDGLTLTASSDDISGDILILSGTLPSTAAVYDSGILASVANVKNNTYKTLVEGKNYLFTQIVTVDVMADTDHTSTITPDSGDFSDYVVPDEGVTVTSVDANYSVVINAPKNSWNVYQAFIQSNDSYTINIPEWLTIKSVTYAEAGDLGTDMSLEDFDAAPIKSITIAFNSVAGLKNGTEASITIPYYDKEGYDGEVVTWTVTYVGADISDGSEPEEPDRPFGISGDKEVSFSFTEAGTQSQDITYYGFDNAALSGLTYDPKPNVELTFSKEDGTDDTGKIIITATVPSTAVSGDYETSFTLYDSENTAKSADVSVKISVNLSGSSGGGDDDDPHSPYAPFSLSADVESLNLDVNTSKDFTVTATTRVTSWDWTISGDEYKQSGITAEIISSDISADVIVNVDSDTDAGEYLLIIKAANAAGRNSSVDVVVTINDFDLEITPDSASLDISLNETSKTITITANKKVVSWDVDGGGLDASKTSGDDKTAVITVKPASSAGSYTITVTARDKAGNEESLSIPVTVSNPVSSFDISAEPSSLTLIAGGEEAASTITATEGFKDSISWAISSHPEGITASLSESTGTSTVLTVSAGSKAISGDYSLVVTATDGYSTQKTAEIKIKVTILGSFTLTANPSTINLVAGGDSQSSALSISGTTVGSISYSKTSSSGLNVVIPSGGSLVYIDADSSATAGEKTVTITATDKSGASAQVTITVNVTTSGGGGSEDPDKPDDPSGVTFALSSDIEKFELADSDTANLTITANKKVVSWDWVISGDEDNESGINVEYVSSDISADFTVSTEGAAAGEYSLIISALDEAGASDDITLTLTVTDSSAEVFTISADPASLEFVIDGDPQTVKLTANKKVVSWTAGYDDDFTVDITESDDTSATATVTPGSYAFEGLITFYATDEDGTDTSTDISVTVNEEELTLTPSSGSLSLTVDGISRDVTITANNLVVSWDVEADSGITAEITESEDQSAIVTVTPGSDAGSYTVTIKARDENGSEKTVTVSVTVSESGSSSDSFTLTPSSSSLNVVVNGSPVTARITASTGYTGTLIWEISSLDSGLTARLSGASGNYVNVIVSASNTATAGAKRLVVTAADEAGTSAQVTITVNVTTSGGSGSYTPPSPEQQGSSFEKLRIETPSATARENIAQTDFQTKVVSTIALRYPQLPDTVKLEEVSSTTTESYKELTDIIASPDLVNFKYIVLNTLSFDEAGVYYFKVPTASSLVAGAKIFLELYYQQSADTLASVSEKKIVLAADATNSSELFNDNWDVITEVPLDLNVNAAAYMQADTEYYPVVKIASGDSSASGGSLGPSGAGCNGGFGSLFGMLAMAFTAGSLYLRKRS